MSAAKAVPIKAKPALCLSGAVAQVDAARTLVLDAQAVITATAAALTSDMNLDEYALSRALRLVSDMLGKVANMIEPMVLEQAPAIQEMPHGQ